ncbi:MAG TPA: hypothetical protein PLE33_06020 [Candidatus Cloacimonas sp.]|nr:hypothetical protein [Candidatus Cloacimonas sp.]HPS60802.1 hypothetical protein [Candidatus Cloacimonas sp.]
MKIKQSDYPNLENRPFTITKGVLEFVNNDNECQDALNELQRCCKYRVVRKTITDYIVKKKLFDQLALLSNEAKIETCWYFYEKIMIGIAKMKNNNIFVCMAKKGTIVLAGEEFILPAEEKIPLTLTQHSKTFNKETELEKSLVESKYSNFILSFAAALPSFIEFAETEKIIMNAGKGKRKAYFGNEKIVTDIRTDIEIIDSTWFRTIIHNGDFEVSGHFRLQPCGKNHSSKKLIWIHDFVKHGYKRIAKIEK